MACLGRQSSDMARLSVSSLPLRAGGRRRRGGCSGAAHSAFPPIADALNHRLVAELIQTLIEVMRLHVDNGAGGWEIKALVKHRQGLKAASLLVAERLPRPLDGGGERPLAVVVTVACLQELEALMQALGHTHGPQHADTRRSQLDGERDAVKRLHDGEASFCAGRVGREGRAAFGGARREELESVRLTKGC